MAGMKRFVTYIYSYENKKKGSNIGFAKIEIRGEDCRIEIHLRGVYAWQSACRVYLFREEAGDIEGIQIGEMKLLNGNGDFGTILKASRIGASSFGINDMEGIFLLSADERIFMSRWKEGNPLEVCRERFREWQPLEPSQREESIETQGAVVEPSRREESSEPQRETPGQARSNAAELSWREESSEPRRETLSQAQSHAVEPPLGEENVQATEIPMRNVFPAYDWLEIWERLGENHPMFTPFEEREAVCIQIELKDLRELPKRYWYLGNNSFLLHGFFNYRYLVVGKTKEERWFIGVPGIYQRQERVMAAIFGFPEFLPTAVSDEKRGEEEPVNRFGCWFRYIEE